MECQGIETPDEKHVVSSACPKHYQLYLPNREELQSRLDLLLNEMEEKNKGVSEGINEGINKPF